MISDDEVHKFRETVWDYFRTSRRDMPWRAEPSPYNVLVSELMLQQTQVSRVLPKFQEFLTHFPNVSDLAYAPLAEVLGVWSGLGYNRRAKFLHTAAAQIVTDFEGIVPDSLDKLVKLPGIGPNTAGAVLAYAYNRPVVFIETNIRSVYFHHFFASQDRIDDKAILPLVEQTLDRDHPREWYWALMDYGTYLKQTRGNNIARSKHYIRQSKFEGSRRQVRGKIIRQLVKGPMQVGELITAVNDARTAAVIEDLVREGFLYCEAQNLRLTGEPKLP